MSKIRMNIAEIDERISIVQENLRELLEQAAAYSGAADEDLLSQRINEQETQLQLLRKQRAELSQLQSHNATAKKSGRQTREKGRPR